MLRGIGAVVAGYALWTVVFLGGGATLRGMFPDAHDADGFTTSIPVLGLYLLISFAASVGAGAVTARVQGNGGTGWPAILGVLLLGTGIPVQLGAWDRIPLWYNLAFLAALVPLTLLGARLAGGGGPELRG